MKAPPLLLQPDVRLTCPHCEQEFSLEAGFARQALESAETASAAALGALRQQESAAAERRAEQLANEREQALRQQLKADAVRAAERSDQERGELQKQLDERTTQIRQLRNEQLTLREERQKLQDEKAALALDVRKQVDAKLTEREQAVRAHEQERATLERAELQKKLDDTRAQLDDTQRRLAQGSQQLQGEVLELAIEEGLARTFPADTIEEVKKGVRGGDVIQRVMTRGGQPAGIILWESKRAKDYSAAWLSKLKDDMRAAAAAVGVLVTMPSAVPKDWPAGRQFAMVDGVWVVVWSVALQLADVLRTALLDVAKQRTVSAGKNEKMEAVYDYVTSPQFALKVRAVYDVFTRMREELESEKSQAQQRWARREKQLQGGMTALLGIGGEIQGLASEDLKMLEMEPPPAQGGEQPGS
jgi:hypothetical protein